MTYNMQSPIVVKSIEDDIHRREAVANITTEIAKNDLTRRKDDKYCNIDAFVCFRIF